MADITYDRLTVGEFENLVTFTDVPNILKVSDTSAGTHADLTIEVVGDLNEVTSADTQWYITFYGDTITNVINPKNANGKRFYASQDETATAFSIGMALRACPKISTAFLITISGAEISLIAKTIGKKWDNISGVLFTNITDNLMETWTTSSGSANSTLFNSKIVVEAYAEGQYDSSAFQSNFDYVTSFEKILTDQPTSFNVSPFLSTVSEYGLSRPYQLNVTAIKEDGDINVIDSFSALSIVGYSVNNSQPYIFADKTKILANNVGKLYVYDNTLDYSLLQVDGYWLEKVRIYNSLDGQIYSADSITYKTSENLVRDISRNIPDSAFTQGYYLTLQINSGDVMRYDIIKPLKTSETFKRVLWRNCYGGVSFFDFVSTQSDSSDVEIETYEKNIFDYYDATYKEKRKIYDSNFKKTFTLTSHLFKEDGKWIFDDMMKSKMLWVKDGNKRLAIIPKSISVEENNTYKGLFTAKFTYELSNEG